MANLLKMTTSNTKKKKRTIKKKKVSVHKFAHICLPYFKQGDDLAQFLEGEKSDYIKALRSHSELLHYSAWMLDEIADRIKKSGYKNIEIEAGTHFIGISGPEDLINKLVAEELAQFEEEDEE